MFLFLFPSSPSPSICGSFYWTWLGHLMRNSRKLLQVVNEKIDEIYRFVTIDANAEAKALETIMSQDGHVDPAHRIK